MTQLYVYFVCCTVYVTNNDNICISMNFIWFIGKINYYYHVILIIKLVQNRNVAQSNHY